MKNNTTTRNEIEKRAMAFLNVLKIDELKELIYSNNMESFPDDHITRKFVDYAYGDNKQTIGFTMCLISLYPYIAQEIYNRYIKYIKFNINIMLHKECTMCIHFKYAENVPDGYIEHKNKEGQVWMLEAKTKHVPQHCPLNQKAYEEWFDMVKDMPRSEYEKIDCNCEHYEAPESYRTLHELLELTKDIYDAVKDGK